MKKLLNLLLVAAMMIAVGSCDKRPENTPPPAPLVDPDPSNGGGGGQVVIKEPVREPKSDLFYERMLEAFCNRFYKSCFDKDYQPSSLTVESVVGDVDDGKAIVKGTHSYKGMMDHNDVSFEATITLKEENYYNVEFKKTTGLGSYESGSESASRNMRYYE